MLLPKSDVVLSVGFFISLIREDGMHHWGHTLNRLVMLLAMDHPNKNTQATTID